MSQAPAPAERPRRSPFPATFYVANVMEVFERMAWYGFFAVSSVYLTAPVEDGGLGFSSMERGVLQGVIPFLLYLFPVITGALADRYGYKRTFLVAFSIMTPAYLLLGQANRVHELTGLPSFPIFFLFFLVVALGAATFKPVVVGTVGRTTDDSNRGLGFGVFYTIVNIGGFVGPLVAGYMRAISWDLVFIMSAVWIGLNFIPTLFVYKEPVPQGGETEERSLLKVLRDAQDVLGNARFALIVVPILLVMMVAGGGWISQILVATGALSSELSTLGMAGVDWLVVGAFSAVWIGANLGWNALVPAEDEGQPWFKQRARVGNWPFVLYLLILAGFWASFLQIFITLPEYIRDFVDTGDLVYAVSFLGDWAVDFLAKVNVDSLALSLGSLVQEHGAVQAGTQAAHEAFLHLVHLTVRVPEPELAAAMTQLASLGASYHQELATLASTWASSYGSAGLDPSELSVHLGSIVHTLYQAGDDPAALSTALEALSHAGLHVPAEVATAELQRLVGEGGPVFAHSGELTAQWAQDYRQVKPEYLINIDAGAIVLFQILVSLTIDRWKPFPVLVVGTIVAGTGIALGSIAVTGALTVFAILVFAFGEMIASPKSQEYVARIAPSDKVALFMGYYFVSVALGNLFGGILSGVGYQVLAKDMGATGLMWILFGGVGFATAGALLVFNKLVVPRLEAQREANQAAEA